MNMWTNTSRWRRVNHMRVFFPPTLSLHDGQKWKRKSPDAALDTISDDCITFSSTSITVSHQWMGQVRWINQDQRVNSSWIQFNYNINYRIVISYINFSYIIPYTSTDGVTNTSFLSVCPVVRQGNYLARGPAEKWHEQTRQKDVAYR